MKAEENACPTSHSRPIRHGRAGGASLDDGRAGLKAANSSKFPRLIRTGRSYGNQKVIHRNYRLYKWLIKS